MHRQSYRSGGSIIYTLAQKNVDLINSLCTAQWDVCYTFHPFVNDDNNNPFQRI